MSIDTYADSDQVLLAAVKDLGDQIHCNRKSDVIMLQVIDQRFNNNDEKIEYLQQQVSRLIGILERRDAVRNNLGAGY